MSKKKKYTNWARYENGRDNELATDMDVGL